MKKILLCITVILICLCSCTLDIIGPTPVRLSDSRFNGTFSYYRTMKGWSSNDGYWYEAYIFDGTNKATKYFEYWYRDGINWAISGNNKGDFYLFEYEIEINSTKTAFRERLWNNPYSSWSDWKPYLFSTAGSLLRIYSYPVVYPTTSYNDYTKVLR